MSNIACLPNELQSIIYSYLSSDEKYNQHYKFIQEYKEIFINRFDIYYYAWHVPFGKDEVFYTYVKKRKYINKKNGKTIIKFTKFNNNCKFISCNNRYSFLDEYEYFFTTSLKLCSEYRKTIKRTENKSIFISKTYKNTVSKDSYYSKIREIKNNIASVLHVFM